MIGHSCGPELLAAVAASVRGQASQHRECQGHEVTGDHRPGSPGRDCFVTDLGSGTGGHARSSRENGLRWARPLTWLLNFGLGTRSAHLGK